MSEEKSQPLEVDYRLTDSGFPMKIGDQEYLASILRDKDYGDLTLYIKSAFINLATKATSELTDDMRKEVIGVALTKATEVGWMTEEGINIIATQDGMIHLGFQMIRKRHPNVTFTQFNKECNKNLPDSITQINIADRMLNWIKKDLGGDPTENQKSDGK